METSVGLKDSGRTLGSVLLVSCVGYSGLFAMPMWVGSVGAARSLSPTILGLLASVQLGAAALAALMVSRCLTSIAVRRGTAVGLCLIAVSNLASVVAPSALALGVARGGSGVGEGIVMSLVNVSIAATFRPDRYFSRSQMALGVFGFGLLAVLPSIGQRLGADALFWLVALLALLVMPCVSFIPNPVKNPVPQAVGASQQPATLWNALLALTLIFVGCQGMWAFIQQAGIAKGLAAVDVTRYLVIGQVVGLLGPLGASAVGGRYSWRSAATVGLIVSGTAVVLATHGRAAFFVPAALMFQFGTLCIVTSILSFLATHDLSGASAAAAPLALNIGCALGPLFIGALWSWQGPAIAGDAALFLYVAGLAALLSQRTLISVREVVGTTRTGF